MRRLLAVGLALLGCLLSIAALIAVWAREEVLDTDRYVASVRPLAADPVVRDELADRVTTALVRRLDDGRLSPPAQLLVRQAVRRQAVAFLASPAFATLWVRTNATLHAQVVRLLREDPGSTAAGSGGLRFDLTPVAAAVRTQVAAQQPALADRLPRVTVVVDVADADQVRQARTSVVWLNRLAVVLPVLTVAALALALGLSRRRVRALGLVLLGLGLAMVATRGILVAGRSLARAHVPDRVAGDPAVAAFYDQLTATVREATTLIGLVALVGGLVALAVSAVAGRQRAGGGDQATHAGGWR